MTDPWSKPTRRGEAFSTIGTKTGSGRDKSPKRKVPEVEQTPCEIGPGNHKLGNVGSVTACRWCGRTWAVIDAELRGTA